jgi:DNA topoisomerase VI subunit A
VTLINRFFCVPRTQFQDVTLQDIIDYGLADATHPLTKTDIKRERRPRGVPP